MKRSSARRFGEAGFSFIEVLLGCLVASILVAVLLTVVTTGRRQSAQNVAYLQALNLAAHVMASIERDALVGFDQLESEPTPLPITGASKVSRYAGGFALATDAVVPEGARALVDGMRVSTQIAPHENDPNLRQVTVSVHYPAEPGGPTSRTLTLNGIIVRRSAL